MKEMIKFSIVIFALILVHRCATQRPPSGGPVDKMPPTITSISPLPNSINVDPKLEVRMEFSERMNQKSVEGAIFVSPQQKRPLSYHWRGRKLRIEFPDSLQEDRTYILTIGANAEDLRRNRMTESLHLAFSTGEKLDQGRISGTVYSAKGATGFIIGAYALSPDADPDPSQLMADYITQCDAEGKYQFSFLSPGNYRLFAISDQDGNARYGRGEEAIGIPTTDVIISEDLLSVENITFQLSLKDTLLPSIRSVIELDEHHADIRFNEAMTGFKASEIWSQFVLTNESLETDTLRLIDVHQNPLDASRFHLITAKQKSDVTYICRTMNLRDLSGNQMDPEHASLSFKGSARPDTTGPKLVYQSIKHRDKNIPLNSKLQFVFSEAIVPGTLEKHLSLTDSAGLSVKTSFEWANPMDAKLIPANPLVSKMKYHVRADVDSIFDMFDNPLADSSIDFEFTTLNEDTLSALLGVVTDVKPDARGKIHLRLKQTGDSELSYYIVMESSGMYRFLSILPGVYFIDGFRDEDGNGVYSYGQIAPFVPAERFVFYPDSIKVRSKWPNEGNDLIFGSY